jgi:hypothetical protein
VEPMDPCSLILWVTDAGSSLRINSLNRDTGNHGPCLACGLTWYSWWAKSGFYIFKWLRKRLILLCEMWKLSKNTHFSVCPWKQLWERNHALSFTNCLWSMQHSH